MVVKVWYIKGLLKEIKVYYCYICFFIIRLWQVSVFNYNLVSESRDAFFIIIVVIL